MARLLRCVCLTAMLAQVVLATSASATELSVTSASPADRASITASESLTFTIVTPLTLLREPTVRVASEDAVDKEGLLYTEGLVALLLESERNPETYTATVKDVWTSKPGTYYWQFVAKQKAPLKECFAHIGNPFCYETTVFLPFNSPVYTLTITPQQTAASPPSGKPSPPTTAQGRTLLHPVAALKSLILGRTHHSASRLVINCKQMATQTDVCAAKWFAAQHPVASTVVYGGHFEIDATHEPATVTFSGYRALYRCVLRHPHNFASRCGSQVSWH